MQARCEFAPQRQQFSNRFGVLRENKNSAAFADLVCGHQSVTSPSAPKRRSNSATISSADSPLIVTCLRALGGENTSNTSAAGKALNCSMLRPVSSDKVSSTIGL